MNVYLCGQRSFGRAVFRALTEDGFRVVGVSAPPTQRDGSPDRLWFEAAERGVPTMPAGALSAATIPAGVDLIVCAHSHDFIGRATRLRARHGALGYHPSLLPLHRGRDAVEWAVRMRDRVTGGSVYWLSDTVDGGPIAKQDWCFVRRDDTASELWARALFPMGVRLLREVVADVSRGIIVAVDQDHGQATWEPSISGRPALYRPDLPLLCEDNLNPPAPERIREMVAR